MTARRIEVVTVVQVDARHPGLPANLWCALTLLASLGLAAPDAPTMPPEYVAPPRPTDGTNMALTVEKLTNGCDPPRPVVIWAIGSSFTEFLGNGDALIAAIRERFPNAPDIVYKRMIGGSTSYHFLRGWARHLVIPDQPDAVLIYNFGKTEDLEALIVELRQRTTADILVPTLHWCTNHKDVWPDPDAPNHHQDPPALREMCRRHGVEFVENRREITDYMLANGLKIEDLLVDSVHQNPLAAKIINMNIARHFSRPERFGYDPRSRERRIEVESASPDLSRDGSWAPDEAGRGLVANGLASMEIRFTGARVDLIGWTAPDGGTLRVWVDGQPASEVETFYATYVNPDPGNFIEPQSPQVDLRRAVTDRCPHRVCLGENIVPQHWTILMTSDEGDYTLVGSVTGPDGEGNAFRPFRSLSGQVIIEPEMWRLATTNRARDRFTFEVRRCTEEKVEFRGPSRKFRCRLAWNLSNGPHTARVEAQGDGPVIVDAFDVFEPPEKGSDRGEEGG